VCGDGYIEYWINAYLSIEIFVNDDSEVVLDTTIFDLIEAGLVEKVDDESWNILNWKNHANHV